MRLVAQGDAQLASVAQGVRQFHTGQLYRIGHMKSGEQVMVDATEALRSFRVSPTGTFSNNTKTVLVKDHETGKEMPISLAYDV